MEKTSGQNSEHYREQYGAVMEANIAVHAKMAADYKKFEPHFRPENIAKVRAILTRLVQETSARKLLDLGCGTGFIIDIAMPLVAEIHGVDITQAMLDQVVRRGPAKVTLTREDTAGYRQDEGTFDLVTSYSFLHHLYDIEPTLRTAYRALRPGGRYYADLDPNRAFWAALSQIEPGDALDPIVRLELEKTRFKDHEVAGELGVDKEVLDRAEYGKNIRGGFGEDELVAMLKGCGFSKVEVYYYWFIGQAQLVNDPRGERSAQIALADRVDEALKRVLPLSRNLYKYLGFIATK
jgi:ubiquinone/menaquinone biosynthesis C-methylase UbiE